MHPKRLELLRKAYPKDNCLSAISMFRLNDYDVPLATPLIINMDPFTAALSSELAEEAGFIKNFLSAGHYYLDEQKRITLARVAEIVPKHIDNVLVTSLSKIKAINLFPSRGDGWDHSYFNLNPKSITVIPVKPLIWDNGYICEVESILGILGNRNIIDQVQELLRSYRYVTYSINKPTKNKIAEIMKELSFVISLLAKSFPANKCYSAVDYNEAYLLMDGLAVTFYKLSDVIAIYDYKRINGVAVDIYACSNQINQINDMPGAVMLYRFIFNADKENLFSIDGETISRWGERTIPISDAVSRINTFLNKNTPQTKSKNAGGF